MPSEATTLLQAQAARILERAAQSKVGIVVKVESRAAGLGVSDVVAPTLRAKQILYRLRREMNFPPMQIRLSPKNPNSELWLIVTTHGEG